jgi:hypothetical protein
MKLRITQAILTMAAVIMFALVAPVAFARQDTQTKPTAKAEVKESGKEVGRAGTSLGHNVRHGRVARGGKHFGRHVGRAGKHVGRAGKRVGHRTSRAVKKAIKP